MKIPMLDPHVDEKPLHFFKTIYPQGRWLLALNSIFYGLGGVCFLLVTGIVGKLVDILSSTTAPSQDQLFTIGFYFVGLLLCHELFYRIGHIINVILIRHIRERTKKVLFDYTKKLSFDYFIEHFAGEIARKIAVVADAGERMIIIFTDIFFEGSIKIAVSVGILFYLHPLLGMIVSVWAALFIIGVLPMARKINKYANLYSQSESITSGAFVDTYANIATVKVYGTHHENSRVFRAIDNESHALKGLGWWSVIAYNYQGMSAVAMFVALTGATFWLYLQNALTIGQVTFIAGISLQLFESVWTIAESIAGFTRSQGECKQALHHLIHASVIPDITKSLRPTLNSITIKYDDVTFSYDHKEAVLKNFNLIIPSGQRVGVVGLSGAGKTTFVSLLLRFFEIQEGKISLNDIDIRSLDQKFLRSHISYMSQDPTLFHMSILENIRYGSPHVSEEDVIEAAKKAQIHDFISGLTHQYHTAVGERGIKLSGGQRQRIMIARAVLRNSPLFVLDEATSALDSESEMAVQHALQELMKGKTVIAVAHRLSTLLSMDRIIFIEHGKIVEDGTHQELLIKDGKYANLWKMQNGDFIEC